MLDQAILNIMNTTAMCFIIAALVTQLVSLGKHNVDNILLIKITIGFDALVVLLTSYLAVAHGLNGYMLVMWMNNAIVVMCITTIALALKRKKLIEDLQEFQAEQAMNTTVVNAAPVTS